MRTKGKIASWNDDKGYGFIAPPTLFSLAFLCALGASVVAGALSSFVLIAYAALSLMAFIAYAIDKSAAKAGRSRISEATLHVWSLAGGWPGALIAQQTLRHKSKKTSFRTVFWATVLINCAALVWLHTESGRIFLEQVLAGSFQVSATQSGRMATFSTMYGEPHGHLSLQADKPGHP